MSAQGHYNHNKTALWFCLVLLVLMVAGSLVRATERKSNQMSVGITITEPCKPTQVEPVKGP